MKDILKQINSVDGIMGSAVFDNQGDVLAHEFPQLIDAAALKKAASLTLECSQGLQLTNSLAFFDLRYPEGRIIIKAFSDAMLFLLCASNINFQVLSITLNLAVKKLAEKLPTGSPENEEATPAPIQKIDDGLLQMNISHLANKQASASFDSLGMVAVSQPTYQFISGFYKTPFKKLTLTNPDAGKSGTFPVMVMKDMDQQYDDTIIVGPGTEKKLQVEAGDRIEVKTG